MKIDRSVEWRLPIRVLLQTVTIVMTVMLVGILAVYASQAARTEHKALEVPVIIDISDDLFSAIQAMRLERGMVASLLRTPDPIGSATQKQISARRTEFTKYLNRALGKLGGIGIGGTKPIVAAIRDAVAEDAEMRRTVDVNLLLPADQRPAPILSEWLASNGKVVGAIESLSSLLENDLSQNDAYIASMIQIKQMTWVVRSDSGDDRFMLREAVSIGARLSDAQRMQFAVLKGRIQGDWKPVLERARLAATPPELQRAIENVDRVYFSVYLPVRDQVIDDLSAGRPVKTWEAELQKFVIEWQKSIFAVATTAFDLSRSHAAAQLKIANRNFYSATILMLVVAIMGMITVIYVVEGVIKPITQITNMMTSVADGNLDCAIRFENRKDEIGSLARALRVFRNNAIEKQKLRSEKEGAEAANRSKSIFLANMSHELRTPLNAIIGFSEILMREMFGAVNERYRRYANDIHDSGNHLLGLINEVLDMSKLEAGKIELVEEPVDLSTVIQDTMRFVEPQAVDAKVQLATSIASDLPLIKGDSRRMRQILLNLLSNSIKFTPGGGMVRVSCHPDHRGMVLIVADTGIGMAPAEIPRALEAFGQIESVLSRKYEGTGLGLPLSHRLVQLHGGTLAIESKAGSGTTVTIVLPPERILRATSAAAKSSAAALSQQFA